jgi:DnaJ-class molecular chaperone
MTIDDAIETLEAWRSEFGTDIVIDEMRATLQKPFPCYSCDGDGFSGTWAGNCERCNGGGTMPREKVAT